MIFNAPENDPTRKGQYAASKRLFGKDNRYAVAPIHSRFDTLCWFVWDTFIPDEAMGIIRISNTLEDAVAGLE